ADLFVVESGVVPLRPNSTWLSQIKGQVALPGRWVAFTRPIVLGRGVIQHRGDARTQSLSRGGFRLPDWSEDLQDVVLIYVGDRQIADDWIGESCKGVFPLAAIDGASPAGFLGGDIGFGALLKGHDASLARVSLALALVTLPSRLVERVDLLLDLLLQS